MSWARSSMLFKSALVLSKARAASLYHCGSETFLPTQHNTRAIGVSCSNAQRADTLSTAQQSDTHSISRHMSNSVLL